jgi:hypothetical protein
MPSENSIYWKIRLTLDVAKSTKATELADLRSEIRGRNLSNFNSRHYDRDKDSYVIGVSERAIRRTLKLCQDLHLIGSDGVLTEEGRQAIRKTQFDAVLASQVRAFLKQLGVDLTNLNKVISKNFHSNPPILPTCQELWTTAGNGIDYSTFSSMLTLLSQCGGAESSQKKLYLYIGSE